MKVCRGCGARLPLDNFRWDNKARGRRKSRCGPCENARMRAYRADNLELRRAADRRAYRRKASDVRRYNLQRIYGITLVQADAVMVHEHCDICGRTAKVVVDHCHESGKNRGVLCGGCNAGLGQFRDSPEILRRAAEYAERGGFGFFDGGSDEATFRSTESK